MINIFLIYDMYCLLSWLLGQFPCLILFHGFELLNHCTLTILILNSLNMIKWFWLNHHGFINQFTIFSYRLIRKYLIIIRSNWILVLVDLLTSWGCASSVVNTCSSSCIIIMMQLESSPYCIEFYEIFNEFRPLL